MTDQILEARNVSLSRDGTTTLNGISLSVAPGERVLIHNDSSHCVPVIVPPVGGEHREETR